MKAEKQRWKYRFDNFRRAYILLQEAADLSYENKLDQLGKEGMIQRFEYTTELAWKTIKDYLESQNIVFALITPRTVIKEAIATKFIAQGEEWMNLIDARNKMSHTYDFNQFEAVITQIKASYLACFDELHGKLLEEYDDESDF